MAVLFYKKKNDVDNRGGSDYVHILSGYELADIERHKLEAKIKNALASETITLVKSYTPQRAFLRDLLDAVSSGEVVTFHTDEVFEKLYMKLTGNDTISTPDSHMFLIQLNDNAEDQYAIWFTTMTVVVTKPQLVVDFSK